MPILSVPVRFEVRPSSKDSMIFLFIFCSINSIAGSESYHLDFSGVATPTLTFACLLLLMPFSFLNSSIYPDYFRAGQTPTRIPDYAPPRSYSCSKYGQLGNSAPQYEYRRLLAFSCCLRARVVVCELCVYFKNVPCLLVYFCSNLTTFMENEDSEPDIVSALSSKLL